MMKSTPKRNSLIAITLSLPFAVIGTVILIGLMWNFIPVILQMVNPVDRVAEVIGIFLLPVIAFYIGLAFVFTLVMWIIAICNIRKYRYLTRKEE